MSQPNIQTLGSSSTAMPTSPEDQQRFLSFLPQLIPIATQLLSSLGRGVPQTPGVPSTAMPTSPEDQQRFLSFLPQLIPIATQLLSSLGRGVPQTPDQQRFLGFSLPDPLGIFRGVPQTP